MKYILRAIVSEAMSFIIVLALGAALVGIGWLLNYWLGDDAFGVAFLLTLVVVQGVIICEKAQWLKRQEKKR